MILKRLVSCRKAAGLLERAHGISDPRPRVFDAIREAMARLLSERCER